MSSSNVIAQTTSQAAYTKLAALLPASVPTPLRALFWLLICFNINAFPTIWHFRVMIPFWRYLLKTRLLQQQVERPSTKSTDPTQYKMVQYHRAWPTYCDIFGFHLSNSSYSAYIDHVRGPYVYTLLTSVFELPTATFALGSTAYNFKKEIGILQSWRQEQSLVGYNKKWIFCLTKFTSKDKNGAVTTHCTALSHVCIKIYGRRTVNPARAFALAGFGPDGASNTAIVNKMTIKERSKWLIGELESDIKVGPEEFGLENKEDWPGAI